MNPKPEIGVYYFPNYHLDPRNEDRHGPGWTEWELVTRAEPRFPGHQQPKVPLWGYEDESDPKVMAKKIDAAADHGIDAFVFDWYWYEDGPFLERALEGGFLQAANRDRLKFAIMWANHTWIDIQPAKASANPFLDATVQFPGEVSPECFDRITDHLVENYFTQPNYWLVDGKPYFSIYDIGKFIEGFGSIEAARQALDGFRQKCLDAGLKGLHLNAILWGVAFLPGTEEIMDPEKMLHAPGFDSFGSYVWIHHHYPREFPRTDYNLVRDKYLEYWDSVRDAYGLPYFPNVTMGWDTSPRTVQSDKFRPLEYPFMATLGENTPERFEEALRKCAERLDRYPESTPRLLTINAWNEWTEGSYLEPDQINGFSYLQAIKNVFGTNAPDSQGEMLSSSQTRPDTSS